MQVTPHISLLSPARDKSVAIAAIQSGANAVYIGAPLFGARQAAGNSLEDISEVVQYAHLYDAQVLVTLNTLLLEDEYAQAVSLAHALYEIGVDALIIQDLHLLQYPLPPIRLHASTQCDNRHAEDIIRLQQMGFKRVVLARELSIQEIREIHHAVMVYSTENNEEPIELEAFVHGALCVSYSGKCFISEVLSGRSANRGACSQYCRMAYDLLDANMQEVKDEAGELIHQRYLLSLQDLDRSASLAELIEAGVTTFKIEGRLKDADYVTNITAYYRELLDSLNYQNGHIYRRSFIPNPEKTFHRGGIDYFLHGRTTHMANWETPKSTGEKIGEVIEARGNRIRVQLDKGIVLHNGDGLTVGADGFSVNGIEGDILRINKFLSLSPQKDNTLFRNLDVSFIRSLRCERKIPINIVFCETAVGFTVRMDKIERHFSYGHEPAKNSDRAIETIRLQMSKLGDTPFTVNEIDIQTGAYFIPISVLNDWRRELTCSLIEHRQMRKPISEMSKSSNSIVKQWIDMPHEACSQPLMTCKYCLLYELGHCRKTHPYPRDKEPKYLRLRNGQILQLYFDCKQCEMRVKELES